MELTFWGAGQGAQVWAHQEEAQDHKQKRAPSLRCGPAGQMDFEPDESSSDLQEGVSWAGWASPSPEGGQRSQSNQNLQQVAVTAQACWPCPPFSGLRAVLPLQLRMRGTVMWF